MPEPFIFACPLCQHVLEMTTADNYRCPQEGTRYSKVDDIWRFLPPLRAAYWSSFTAGYEAIRQAEGRGSHEANFYRALPFVPATHPQARFWRGREQSYQVLLQEVISKLERPQTVDEKGKEIPITPLKIVDMGAGNGWMSYSLTQIGHQVAAVDLLTNSLDGLGAFVHYDAAFTKLQAEFDHLPLAAQQADVVIFNASFHYASDYAVTLAEAQRILKPAGIIVVLDTPLYRNAAVGEQMVAERDKLVAEKFGIVSDSSAAGNFITLGRVSALATQLGLAYELIPTVPLWQRLGRRFKRRVAGQRPAAEFPLIVWRLKDEESAAVN